MIDQIESLIEEIQNFTTDSPEKAEEFRIKFLGKKGIIFSRRSEVFLGPKVRGKGSGVPR